MTQSNYPCRMPGLDIKPVEDGYVVHQPERNRVHHLNRTAALILELCNGSTPAAELPQLLQLAFGLPQPPVEPVVTCLEELKALGLLRRRIVYADAGLATEHGHHIGYCRLITGELRQRGIEPEVFGRAGLDAAIQSELSARAHFRHDTYWWTDGDPVCGWLSAFIKSAHDTGEDLARIDAPGADDIVYVSHVSPAQLMAAAKWLAAMPPARRPHVVLEFGMNPGLDEAAPGSGLPYSVRDPRFDPQAVLYRVAIKELPDDPGDRLHLVTPERELSVIYSALLERPVGVLPTPFLASGPLRNRAGA